MTRAALAFATGWIVALTSIAADASAQAAPSVNTTPSKRTLDEASRSSCDGVSVVVQRCATPADDAADKAAANPRSRATPRAASDRGDARAKSLPQAGSAQPASAAATADAERLGPVTVTGKAAEKPPSVEEVLQRALSPAPVSANGTVSSYGPDGVRYDCVAKCVGPACCATVRSLPNPARDSNSIGR